MINRGILKSTKHLYLGTFLTTCFFTAIFEIFGHRQDALFCIIGGHVSLLLVFKMALVVKAILDKKSVAFAGSVIVFKYAILVAIFYLILKTPGFSVLGFLVGILSFIPGCCWWILQTRASLEN